MKGSLKKHFINASVACVCLLASSALMAQAVYKIGLAGPMTGGVAAYGEQMRRGAQLAVEDLNAAGGINGKKVEMVIADDACEPKQAVAVASRLVEKDKVNLVLGHFCSSSTIPASDVYAEADMLMITPGATSPQVTERKLPNVLRTCGRDDQQGLVAGNYIVDILKSKRVVLIHDKDTYGQGVANATQTQLHKRGLKEIMYEGLTRGEKDYNALVTKIKSANADLIHFSGLSSEAGTLLRQVREQGLTTRFMVADGAVADTFAAAAGNKSILKGVLMTFGEDPRLIAGGKTVVEKFRKSGFEPSGFTLYTYASVQVAAAALKSAKSTSGVALAKWIKANTVPTILGKKTWDDKGDLTSVAYVVNAYKDDGSYVQVSK